MSDHRLKVESGPPEHMYSADHEPAGGPGDTSPADGAKEQAQELAGQAKEQAQERAQAAAEQAKQRAAAQVDERSTQLGQQVGAQAQAIDGVAGTLREQGKDGPAKIAEQASEKVREVASRLEQADGESLVSKASEVARENPAAAAAAGAAAGFVAGRVIKAAASDGPAEEPEAPGHQGDGGG
jgi:uncharacterized coiled-coil protein SlyX